MLISDPTDATLPDASTDEPRYEEVHVEVAGEEVVIKDDYYSDRIRCDHPPVDEAAAETLARTLIEEAGARDRGRVVLLAPVSLTEGLAEAGLVCEGTMPGFYRGEEDCAVMGWFNDGGPRLARPDEVAEVQALLGGGQAPTPRETLPPTERAVVEDAPQIAALIGETFAQYPTPSGVPEYIATAIADGHPFRVVRDEGEVVACASADLVPEALTAELTDCATRPTHRGRGFMQALLSHLMDDLRDLGYPTAFTLARARIAGVNLAFERLGFGFGGTMARSCRIGEGLEDMNIWSRRLDAAAAATASEPALGVA